MEVASFFNAKCNNDSASHASHHHLLPLVKELCLDPVINSTGVNMVGPALYLIKLLIRQYGFPCLRKVFKNHQWIIPKGLCITDKVRLDCCILLYLSTFTLQEKVVDPFVIYRAEYSALREDVSAAVFGKQVQGLDEATQVYTYQLANNCANGKANPMKLLKFCMILTYASCLL